MYPDDHGNWEPLSAAALRNRDAAAGKFVAQQGPRPEPKKGQLKFYGKFVAKDELAKLPKLLEVVETLSKIDMVHGNRPVGKDGKPTTSAFEKEVIDFKAKVEKLKKDLTQATSATGLGGFFGAAKPVDIDSRACQETMDWLEWKVDDLRPKAITVLLQDYNKAVQELKKQVHFDGQYEAAVEPHGSLELKVAYMYRFVKKIYDLNSTTKDGLLAKAWAPATVTHCNDAFNKVSGVIDFLNSFDTQQPAQ